MGCKYDVNDGDDDEDEDDVNRTVVQQLVQATAHQAQHDYKYAGTQTSHNHADSPCQTQPQTDQNTVLAGAVRG